MIPIPEMMKGREEYKMRGEYCYNNGKKEDTDEESQKEGRLQLHS